MIIQNIQKILCHFLSRNISSLIAKFQVVLVILLRDIVFQILKYWIREKRILKKSARKFERSKQTTAVKAKKSRLKVSNTKIQTFGLTRKPFSAILSHFKSLSLYMISFVEFHSYISKAIIANKQSLWYAKKKPQHACASCKQIVEITGSVFLLEMENRYFVVLFVLYHLKAN